MERKGMLVMLVAYAIGGLLPLYKLWAEDVSSFEVIGIRIMSAFIFVSAILLATKNREIRSILRNRKQLRTVALAGLILGFNWSLYLWAIQQSYIIETSLGYYINPLVSVLFGVVFFKERLSKAQMVATLFAVGGVLILGFGYERFPWIALSLALSFSLYSALKKRAAAPPLTSLLLETGITLPFVLIGWTVFLQTSSLETGAVTVFVLAMLGVATAVQMMLFGYATNRIPFIYVGILQYIAPTLSLMLGVFVYGEPFTSTHLFAFSFIWVAVLLFTASGIRMSQKKEKLSAA